MRGKLLGILICALLAAGVAVPGHASSFFGPDSASGFCMDANTKINTITGFNGRATGIVVDHHRGVVYSTSKGGVVAIDEATNAVITTIPVSGVLETLALDPFRGTVYVPSYINTTLSVIDEATNTVTATIAMPYPGNSFAIGVDPYRGKVYVALESNAQSNPNYKNYVAVIDEATNAVIKTINNVPPYGPQGVGVDPIRGIVWVSGGPGGSPNVLYAIDERTDTVTATIPLPCQSFAPTVDLVRGIVYVPNTCGSVTVIDEATNTITDTIPTGNITSSVGLDPVTRTAYASNYGPSGYTGGYVSVIDAVTNTVTDTITLGGAAGGPGRGVAVDPVRRTVYVTNWKLNTVTVISAGGPTPWRDDWRDPFGDFFGDHWKR